MRLQLASAPATYSQHDEAQLRSQLEQADGQNVKTTSGFVSPIDMNLVGMATNKSAADKH